MTDNDEVRIKVKTSTYSDAVALEYLISGGNDGERKKIVEAIKMVVGGWLDDNRERLVG